jgi:hypothetical protein
VLVVLVAVTGLLQASPDLQLPEAVAAEAVLAPQEMAYGERRHRRGW